MSSLRLAVCTFLSIAIMFPGASAQELPKVILSEKVGAEIDTTERSSYQLYRTVKDFHELSFLDKGNIRFEAHFTLGNGDGTYRDSSAECTLGAILMLAEKIQNYDALVRGKYFMGQRPVAVTTTAGITYPNAESEKNAAAELPPVATSQPIPKRASGGDLLPFATDPGKKERLRLPWSFSISIVSYSPDLSGLQEAVRSMESNFNASIPHKSVDVATSPLICLNLGCNIASSFRLQLEAATATPSTLSLYASSLSILYYPMHAGHSAIQPYFGFGLGSLAYKVTIEYDARIYGDTYLTTIYSDGGCYTTLFQAGIDITSHEGLFMTAFARFISVPEQVAFTDKNVRASLRLSSYILGAGFGVSF